VVALKKAKMASLNLPGIDLTPSDFEPIEEFKDAEETQALFVDISHPFLVPARATFQSSRHIYKIMDYMAGGDLRERLDVEGKFTESRARLYIADIALALGLLHGCFSGPDRNQDSRTILGVNHAEYVGGVIDDDSSWGFSGRGNGDDGRKYANHSRLSCESQCDSRTSFDVSECDVNTNDH
jgi:hypothetical protein